MKKLILALALLSGCAHGVFPTANSVRVAHPELGDYIREDLGGCPFRNLQYKAKSNKHRSVFKAHCVSTGAVAVYDCPHEISFNHDVQTWTLARVGECRLVKSSSRRDRQINTAIGVGAALLLTR